MHRRIDSPSGTRVPLHTDRDRTQPSHGDESPAQTRALTRSMAGLSMRASPERAPGAQGMAPRGAAPNLGAPRQGPRVQFGRNQVLEADGQQHSGTIDFGRKPRPQRGVLAPAAESSSHAVPQSPSRPAAASSQPSLPKSGGFFSKLLKGGSSKSEAKPAPGAGRSGGAAAHHTLPAAQPSLAARPSAGVAASASEHPQDLANRFSAALTSFMACSIDRKHKTRVADAVLRQDDKALGKALSDAAYLNVNKEQTDALRALAETRKKLHGDFSLVQINYRIT